MFKDEIGARMKQYEHQVTGWKIDRELPVYARIDGRAFSSITRGMNKPYDIMLMSVMQSVLFDMVERSNALIGYTQSDEISLLWHWNGENEEAWFGGKLYKLTSILASLAAASFHRHLPNFFSKDEAAKLQDMLPHFDCRVMNLPSEIEAANMFVWRNMDAKRNSLQSLAQSHFSSKALHGKSTKDMLRMLKEKNVSFDDLPSYVKYGTWVRSNFLTKHNLNYYTTPHDFRRMTNRTDFLFRRQEPIFGDNNERTIQA